MGQRIYKLRQQNGEKQAKNRRGRWEAWIGDQGTPREKEQARFRRQAEECSATLAPQIPNPAKEARTQKSQQSPVYCNCL